MQIKVIYEDETLLPIKESISKLDSSQLFFVEQHIRVLRQERQEAVFQQWLCAMQKLLRTYS